MPTIHLSDRDLLNAVEQLPPEELNSFLAAALSLRRQTKPATLSAAQSRLIERINRGISDEIRNRYEQLSRKRKKRPLSPDEHEELLKLTSEIEARDADRAGALLGLAKLRRVPVRLLMEQMGIPAALPRG